MENNKFIDLSYLIESSLRDKEFVLQMLNLFSRNAPKLFSELKEYIDQEEWQLTARKAHKFKSSVGIVGAIQMENCLDSFENSLYQLIDDGEVYLYLSKLSDALKGSLEETNKYIDNPELLGL